LWAVGFVTSVLLFQGEDGKGFRTRPLHLIMPVLLFQQEDIEGNRRDRKCIDTAASALLLIETAKCSN
jgi:hypothetical protein